MYERIFKRCDLPLPKCPEIQQPIFEVGRFRVEEYSEKNSSSLL
jgi:hypothetical protein